MNEYGNEQPEQLGRRRRRAMRRAPLFIPCVLAIGVLAAACGSNSGSPPASSGGSGAGAGSRTTAVDTATLSNVGTVLVTSKGFTLYRLNKDSMDKSTCSGACAKIWPPLLVSGGGSPMAGSGVAGLGTISVAGGKQVTYHGMPLYTYAGDSSAGQANGQDLTDQWGTWFAVTTSASTGGGTPTTSRGTPTTTTSGGGGGVGF